jgi:glycosyltransferase involved in cell wall biosynthesis
LAKTVHIISWEVPYPPIKGGIIDVFYKIKALSTNGIEIILHCFVYENSQPQKILETYCKKIYYYKRPSYLNFVTSDLPFIVASRKPKELLQNLLLDKHPIIFEGIHTCGFLNERALAPRNKIVRPQNIEANYYAQLAEHESSLVKRTYYKTEAKRLEAFEYTLHNADVFNCVAEQDHHFFEAEYSNAIHKLIPSFHGFASSKPDFEISKYCLYQGNLSIAENAVSALYLIENIFNKIGITLVIAGANPSQKLYSAAANIGSHIKILPNPTALQMGELMQNAQINILPSFQNTGLKLKLLHALYGGKHCLVNKEMLNGTFLKEACVIANTPNEFIEAIKKLIQIPFTEINYNYRLEILNENYSVEKNVEDLIALL